MTEVGCAVHLQHPEAAAAQLLESLAGDPYAKLNLKGIGGPRLGYAIEMKCLTTLSASTALLSSCGAV